MLSLTQIRQGVEKALTGFPVKSVVLFGSYADGKPNEQSDVDLIVEFTTDAVSLLTLSGLRLAIEEELGLPVDLVHGPISEDSFIEAGETVMLYAA